MIVDSCDPMLRSFVFVFSVVHVHREIVVLRDRAVVKYSLKLLSYLLDGEECSVEIEKQTSGRCRRLSQKLHSP